LSNFTNKVLSGAIWETDATSGSLLGGCGPAGATGGFTNVRATITNTIFRAPDNPGVTLINLKAVAGMHISDVACDTAIAGIPSQPTHSNGMCLVGSAAANDGLPFAENVLATGFYQDYWFAEHTTLIKVIGFASLQGFEFGNGAGYDARINSISCIAVGTCLEGGTGGQMVLQIDRLNLEPQSFGGAWMGGTPPFTGGFGIIGCNDPNNYLLGSVTYSWSIYYPPAKVGCANLEWHDSSSALPLLNRFGAVGGVNGWQSGPSFISTPNYYYGPSVVNHAPNGQANVTGPNTIVLTAPQANTQATTIYGAQTTVPTFANKCLSAQLNIGMVGSSTTYTYLAMGISSSSHADWQVAGVATLSAQFYNAGSVTTVASGLTFTPGMFVSICDNNASHLVFSTSQDGITYAAQGSAIAETWAINANPFIGVAAQSNSTYYAGQTTFSNLNFVTNSGGPTPGIMGQYSVVPVVHIERGSCTFSGTTCTFTFVTAYSASPACIATDQTSAAPVQAAPATSSVVLTGGIGAGATDVAAVQCWGNPN
jgi:hypothetical protein